MPNPDWIILENTENWDTAGSSSITAVSQMSPIDLATLICEVQFNVVESRIISSAIFYWMRFIA